MPALTDNQCFVVLCVMLGSLIVLACAAAFVLYWYIAGAIKLMEGEE